MFRLLHTYTQLARAHAILAHMVHTYVIAAALLLVCVVPVAHKFGQCAVHTHVFCNVAAAAVCVCVLAYAQKRTTLFCMLLTRVACAAVLALYGNAAAAATACNGTHTCTLYTREPRVTQ